MQAADVADIFAGLITIAIAATILSDHGGVNKTQQSIEVAGSLFTGALSTVEGK